MGSDNTHIKFATDVRCSFLFCFCCYFCCRGRHCCCLFVAVFVIVIVPVVFSLSLFSSSLCSRSFIVDVVVVFVIVIVALVFLLLLLFSSSSLCFCIFVVVVVFVIVIVDVLLFNVTVVGAVVQQHLQHFCQNKTMRFRNCRYGAFQDRKRTHLKFGPQTGAVVPPHSMGVVCETEHGDWPRHAVVCLAIDPFRDRNVLYWKRYKSRVYGQTIRSAPGCELRNFRCEKKMQGSTKVLSDSLGKQIFLSGKQVRAVTYPTGKRDRKFSWRVQLLIELWRSSK